MESVLRYTARLTLRNLRLSDLDAVCAYRSDGEVLRHIGETMSRAEVAVHLERCAPGWSRREGETLHLAVALRADDAVVLGEVMLRGLRLGQRQAEMGIALGARHHRQGYGAEALLGLLAYGFEALRLHRLFGFADVENRASLRMSEELGFVREGRLRQHMCRGGQWRDEYVVSLLEDEWPAVRERHAHLLGLLH